MDKHFVYIVKCNDGSLYTGYAKDVNARISMHNEGKGAKYTKMRRPVQLVYQEVYYTKSEALKREYEIKTFSRQKKLKMIEGG
ncbi:GIY-YIG nuclease family protein [Staphylococcus saccharolyticus]|uniref:GIY-YIG catalytic domain-containing protein n=1 Tax=Staphylococcus saccharolyticus TaxID=33028 RepID=A0A380HAJ8_9STAP|nr:GIY-YIG nuclease family protein [Staphylococcus saccharolyticus]MBL7566088.1 GIY-YIG nuclease family protein [Staphylococcus saccharolyticus]MBL7572546.1 GIY-YIG nuclease family protein [Staphylococcus saccharolyticus]QQB99214.1 GIY-YIG nuclease family protein [Staphylococcus saccharolyticus]QRJ66595.1 GIY-YIG nuclease family protein [Staphylococcus saccharolyticus]RTX95534.1 GIY-YIG nuclease family protein [Staphylococcus saccharolyticus]